VETSLERSNFQYLNNRVSNIPKGRLIQARWELVIISKSVLQD